MGNKEQKNVDSYIQKKKMAATGKYSSSFSAKDPEFHKKALKKYLTYNPQNSKSGIIIKAVED